MVKDTSRRRRAMFGAAALLLAANPVQADGQWVMTKVYPILMSRVDPIANPGTPAGHCHNVLGASNIRSHLNHEAEMLNAVCTSVPLKKDMSNYWTPSLLFNRPDGMFEAIPTTNRVYYNLHGDNVQPFPAGMRIISGTGNSRFQWDERARGVYIDCDKRDSGIFLPNGTSEPGGCNSIHIGIHFPSCGWANQSLDSDDHWSHMTWPIDTGGGNVWQKIHGDTCPESHPIKYPHIFIESNYYLTDEQKGNWRSGNVNNLILSNGDLGGASFHGDFVNGWDPATLKAGLEQCNRGGIGEALENCPVFKDHVDYNSCQKCRHQGMIPDEDCGWTKPLKYLPGCNPVWPLSAGDDKPTDCPWYKDDPPFVAPSCAVGEYNIENVIPVSVELNNGTCPQPIIGKDTYAYPWNGQTTPGMARNAVWLNSDAIMTQNKDGAGNYAASSSLDQVAGMQDASFFTERKGPGITDPSKMTYFSNVPKGPVWFPGEAIGAERPPNAVNPDHSVDIGSTIANVNNLVAGPVAAAADASEPNVVASFAAPSASSTGSITPSNFTAEYAPQPPVLAAVPSGDPSPASSEAPPGPATETVAAAEPTSEAATSNGDAPSNTSPSNESSSGDGHRKCRPKKGRARHRRGRRRAGHGSGLVL